MKHTGFCALLVASVIASAQVFDCSTGYLAWNRNTYNRVSTTKTLSGSTHYVLGPTSYYTTYVSSTTVTISSTSTSIFTYYTTIASTTGTIPTSAGLILFASITPIPPDPYTATATVVNCVSTVSLPSTTSTLTLRFTRTYTNPGTVITTTLAASTTLTTHSTIQTSTATVYQACLTSANKVSTFASSPIYTVVPLGVFGGYYPVSAPAQKQSIEDCCNAVFADAATNVNISGYIYSPGPATQPWNSVCGGLGSPGSQLFQGWQFFTENFTPTPPNVYFVGTGPRNPPKLIYGGVCAGRLDCPLRNQA